MACPLLIARSALKCIRESLAIPLLLMIASLPEVRVATGQGVAPMARSVRARPDVSKTCQERKKKALFFLIGHRCSCRLFAVKSVKACRQRCLASGLHAGS